MQKLEINYGNSINIYEVASAQWKYLYDAKINLGKIELKLNVQDKDICLSFQLDNLRPNGIEVGLQSIIQKENIFALTKIFDVQEVSMRVEEISKSSLFIKLIFDENVISLWFDNEQIHSYNDRMQVLECIPTRYSYTANQMMNEYNNMLAKEFCEKYQYLILFEDSNQYINQYYESTFLGKVLIGYLIEEQAIIQMPKVHYIEDVVNLFLEQDTKLIQIMIDEDYCYYSYIPRYIELSNWMKLEIKDMGIYADALKQKAQPMAKKKRSLGYQLLSLLQFLFLAVH